MATKRGAGHAGAGREGQNETACWMIEAARATRMPCGGNCTRDRRRTLQEFRHSVAGLPAAEDADARKRRIAVAGGLTLNGGTNGHFAFRRTDTARGSVQQGPLLKIASNRGPYHAREEGSPAGLSALGQRETNVTTEPWSAVEWIADADPTRHRSIGVRCHIAEIRPVRATVRGRAIPCSNVAQQRLVTVGIEPTQTGDPTHARLYHWQ